jgi:hypothetical protein
MSALLKEFSLKSDLAYDFELSPSENDLVEGFINIEHRRKLDDIVIDLIKAYNTQESRRNRRDLYSFLQKIRNKTNIPLEVLVRYALGISQEIDLDSMVAFEAYLEANNQIEEFKNLHEGIDLRDRIKIFATRIIEITRTDMKRTEEELIKYIEDYLSYVTN